MTKASDDIFTDDFPVPQTVEETRSRLNQSQYELLEIQKQLALAKPTGRIADNYYAEYLTWKGKAAAEQILKSQRIRALKQRLHQLLAVSHADSNERTPVAILVDLIRLLRPIRNMPQAVYDLIAEAALIEKRFEVYELEQQAKGKPQ